MSELEDNTSRPQRMRPSLSQKEILIQQVQEEGKTIAEAAKIANINANTAKSILAKYKKNDYQILQRACGGKRREKLTPEVLNKIEGFVERNPSLTLKEIQQRLSAAGVRISIQTVQNGLRNLKITLKIAFPELDKINAPSTIQQRMTYARDFARNAPERREKCIFIDECGFNLHLRRTQARSSRGQRSNIVVPTIRGRNVTVIAAINTEGIKHHKIISDSTCNSAKFCIFLRELVEILGSDREMEGAWVVMDNARIHKTAEVREIVYSKSYFLKFLPPYSPMLNPIENAFSKIKTSARRLLSEQNQGGQTLIQIIEESLNSVRQSDCNNYVMNMLVKLSSAAAGERLC